MDADQKPFWRHCPTDPGDMIRQSPHVSTGTTGKWNTISLIYVKIDCTYYLNMCLEMVEKSGGIRQKETDYLKSGMVLHAVSVAKALARAVPTFALIHSWSFLPSLHSSSSSSCPPAPPHQNSFLTCNWLDWLHPDLCILVNCFPCTVVLIPGFFYYFQLLMKVNFLLDKVVGTINVSPGFRKSLCLERLLFLGQLCFNFFLKLILFKCHPHRVQKTLTN